MPIELKVPAVGESITEVQIGEWQKAEGDRLSVDETVVLIDTEKTTVELPAPTSGTLTQILKNAGDIAHVGDVIGLMESGDAPTETPTETPTEKSDEPQPEWNTNTASSSGKPVSNAQQQQANFVMPSAQRLAAQNDVDATQVAPSGPGGRVLKEDVQKQLSAPAQAAPTATTAPATTTPSETLAADPDEEIVPMTLLRRRVAENLVRAQQNAALLTTFNEIDMSAVMQLRKENQEAFQKKYGIKLGFMSFFVKASIDALKQIPGVNAEVRGTDIVYRNHYDIGVAIGGGKGLVVPVLKRAERMSFAEIEMQIADFAKRAKESTLKPDELMGGTFTITNGGIYGSLLSTPIVNAPQSGILGMHSIQERPIARNGQVVIAPMMYVALTYDHRVVDGREAVTFLVRIKECLENPARMLIEV